MTVISAWKAAPSLHTSSLVHPQSAYPTSTFHPWPVRQPEQRDPDSSFWRSKNRVVRKEWVKWRVKKKGGQSSEVSVLRSNHTVVAVAFFFFFEKQHHSFSARTLSQAQVSLSVSWAYLSTSVTNPLKRIIHLDPSSEFPLTHPATHPPESALTGLLSVHPLGEPWGIVTLAVREGILRQKQVNVKWKCKERIL